MPSTHVDLPTSRRLSVTMSGRDLADLDLIRRSPERLRSLPAEVSETSSEAALVHAVFEAGLQCLKEEAQESAYALLAQDTEYVSYREARRGAPVRRRPE